MFICMHAHTCIPRHIYIYTHIHMYTRMPTFAVHRCIGVHAKGRWKARTQAARAISNILKQHMRSSSWKPTSVC